MVGTFDFQGYPSILEPQLKSDLRAGIVLDSTSEGLVVSLDYGSTIIISVVAGQLQVGHGVLVSSKGFSVCWMTFINTVSIQELIILF